MAPDLLPQMHLGILLKTEANSIVTDSSLKKAQKLMHIQAKAIERAALRLEGNFEEALTLIRKAVSQKNKLVFMGVGKSHYVAHKLAASFMSTGVTAIFVHPGEALHGDLGSIQKDDLVLLFSKSGRSAEILGLLPFFKNRNPSIALTGDLNSPLATHCDIILDASVEKEACPINMLPTASTTVALALGDALVSCFAEEQGFDRSVFAGYHPGGSIGKRLNHTVGEVFHSKEKCATTNLTATLTEVAELIGKFPLGVCNILDDQGCLLGIITDGDLRRAWAAQTSPHTPAEKLMINKPITLIKELLKDDAIATLEQKDRRVNCAPVLDDNNLFLGLVHIHDLI